MTIKLPSIDILFKQKAASLISRSQMGFATLIVKDNTDTTFDIKEYKDITQALADSELYTSTNLGYIKDVLNFAPYRFYVVRVGTTETIADALNIISKNIKKSWITIADGTTEDFNTLASWTKTQENNKKTYKAITYKTAITDCKHIVNFYNDKVVFNDTRGEVTGEKYCPSLLGIVASRNLKGVTNYKCSNLLRVEEVADNDKAVSTGQLILINNNDTVNIAVGINSMITTDGINNTEDMKYIDTVEVMDLILDDIRDVFINEYLGNYKNKYDNQMLFISSINGYLKDLAKNDILDNEYANVANIDVEAQRDAWLASGKSEAVEWEDSKVKSMAFKRDVFLAGDIKILGSIDNLKFEINMF